MINLKITTLGMIISAFMAIVTVAIIVSSVITVRGIEGLDETWVKFETGPAKKIEYLQEMSSALGYGGMIHQFKNYVLRQDRPRIIKAQTKIRAATVALAAYRAIGVNEKEDEALKSIGAVIIKYADALAVAETLADQNSTPRQVDKAIKISDGPALKGLAVLMEQFQIARDNSSKSVHSEVAVTSNLASTIAIAVGLVLAALVVVLFWFTSLHLGRPLNKMTESMTELAEGHLEIEIPSQDRGDEIGRMAHAVQVFKDNAVRVQKMEAEQHETVERAEEEKRQMMHDMADDFENNIGGIVEAVSSASTELQSSSDSMAAMAQETSTQATTVAAASEEASTNVQTVASAAEELSSSISEISRQVSQSTQVAGTAVAEVEGANGKIQGLAEAANKIGEVVALITDIADQTNLLALNATIEAARAGEAGKGFAVVASEVKNLANQTAKATEEISSQISGIQGATQEAVSAIGSIGGIINQINEITSTIAAAVEEQGAATQEIARNVEQASNGTAEVSSTIQSVTQAAGESGAAASQIQGASKELSQQSEMLRSQVDSFLNQVRTG